MAWNRRGPEARRNWPTLTKTPVEKSVKATQKVAALPLWIHLVCM